MVFERACEISDSLCGLGIPALLFGQIRPPGIEQTAAIDEPETRARFRFG